MQHITMLLPFLNSCSPLPFFLCCILQLCFSAFFSKFCFILPKNCKYAPHKRLLVVTCVGVWVVTVGSVPCLGNSQVITKSGLKFVIVPSFLGNCTFYTPQYSLPARKKCSQLKKILHRQFGPYQLLPMVTCELPRQETDPTVTTHTPTQVTTGSS